VHEPGGQRFGAAELGVAQGFGQFAQRHRVALRLLPEQAAHVVGDLAVGEGGMVNPRS
jgi:hypothetical protein